MKKFNLRNTLEMVKKISLIKEIILKVVKKMSLIK
jgi:hypothetical protein